MGAPVLPQLGKLMAVWLAAGAAAGQSGPPPPPPAVAKVAAQAAAAREANRLDEAVKLYRQALATAPRWQEGWWDLGTLYYERDKYTDCRDAFRRFTTLNRKMSGGYAFLGLCEFQLREFGPALEHLEKAYLFGLPLREELTRVTLYHMAMLQTKAGNYERAMQICRLLARMKPEDPQTIAVAGIAGLRRPLFPHEIDDADRDVTIKLGSAMLTGGEHSAEEALRRFEALVKEYPSTPNVHYTYAMLLLANDPAKGLAELKRELEVGADNVPALVSISFEYLSRGDAREAQPYAVRAVKLAPENFAARACLGRVLLEREDPDLAGAIRELEAAVKLAPDSPQVHFSLASAYSKAGRKQEAEKERAEFARLKKLTAANPVGLEVK